jgi:hypothetical protein
MSQRARLDRQPPASTFSARDERCSLFKEINMSARRIVAVIVVWTGAAILGLTVAILAVALLGLWVAVGALAGLGATVVGGWLGQIHFATDFDAVLAERAAAEGSRGDMS